MTKTIAQTRKEQPVYRGVLKYFPKALVAIAELSQIGNEKDALMRYLLEAETLATDGVIHSTKVTWRALENLEKELEGEK